MMQFLYLGGVFHESADLLFEIAQLVNRLCTTRLVRLRVSTERVRIASSMDYSVDGCVASSTVSSMQSTMASPMASFVDDVMDDAIIDAMDDAMDGFMDDATQPSTL